MKKLLSLFPLLLLLLAGNSFSQYSYQDINSQLVNKSIGAIGSDNSGNVIVSGTFATTITFGSVTFVNNVPPNDAGFVVKLAPDGSVSWAKCINLKSSMGDTYGPPLVWIGKIVTDAAGNIYITGGYKGVIKMDNISLTSSKDTPDIFTVKMSSSGVFLWAKSEGTSDDGYCTSEGGYSVTTDAQGNVYTIGYIIGKVFKNVPVSLCGCGTTKPVTAIYVVKYNSSGTKLWEKKYMNSLETSSSPCNYDPEGRDISCDGANVYIAGTIYGSVTFGSATLNTGSNSIANTFLVKLDGNGNTLWARGVTNSDNKGLHVLLDNNNTDVYLSGSFSSGTITFGGPSLTTTFNNTEFIGKYSSTGNCSWAVIAGRASTMRHHTFKHPNGNLVAIVGGFIYPNSPFTYKEFSTLDGAIVDSTVASVVTSATDVVTLPGGFVYAQNLKGSYDFGGITIASTQPIGSNYSDMILVKYGSGLPLMAHPTNVTPNLTASGIMIYPNPANDQITIVNSPGKMLGTISICDISGKMIFQKEFITSDARIDVQDLSPGIYFLKAGLDENMKFVKQ